MSMSRQGAERAVIVSALVVFGIYSYRLLTEGHASGKSSSSGGVGQLLGIGAPANIGRFITGWGFAFFVLAILAEAAPPLGGSMAILVATGDTLGNFGQVATDVNTKLGVSKQSMQDAARLQAYPDTPTSAARNIPIVAPH